MAAAEVTADALGPVQASTARFLPIKRMLMRCASPVPSGASCLANRTVNKVYRKVGLLQLDK